MSDIQKLKALAIAAKNDCGDYVALNDYGMAMPPVVTLDLIAEIERLKTLRSKTERDLEQELEVWRHGPSCWNCGDTGDVHDPVGEWRGECDCLAAQLIGANHERDQLRAEREALQQRLTVADQRVDDLQIDLAAARELLKHGSSPTPAHCESVLDFLASQSAPAAKDACSTCGGTKLVDDGELTCSSGGIPYENGPIQCVKDCPDCTPTTETCQFPQSCTTMCGCKPGANGGLP